MLRLTSFLRLALVLFFISLPVFSEAKTFVVKIPAGNETREAILNASSKTRVRPSLLYGLLGQETSYGANLGKTDSEWNSFCSTRSTEDCFNWRNYDCKADYANAHHFDEILKNLDFVDSHGNADRTEIPISSTCAMGFTQLEPNTWWEVFRGRQDKIYNPWDIHDAILAAAYYVEDLGADSDQILDADNVIGPRDRIALQRYYCGANYDRPECRFYAYGVESKARRAEEVLLSRDFHGQLEKLQQQRNSIRQQLELEPVYKNPFQSFYDFFPKGGEFQTCVRDTALKDKFELTYQGEIVPREQLERLVPQCLYGGGFFKGLDIFEAFGRLPPFVQQCIQDAIGGDYERFIKDPVYRESRVPLPPEAGERLMACPGMRTFMSKVKALSEYVEAKGQIIEEDHSKEPLSLHGFPGGSDERFNGFVEFPFSSADGYPLFWVSGGDEPYTWVINSGKLPDGLTLQTDPGGTGNAHLLGNPTTPGDFSFTVQITDSKGRKGVGTMRMTIYDRLRIVTTDLPRGKVGNYYEAELLASGGGGPAYRWEIISGSLPPGLVLAVPDYTQGIPNIPIYIEGTPTTPGTFSFTVKTIDLLNENLFQTKELIITVIK